MQHGLKLGKQLKWEKCVAGCYLNTAAAFGYKGELDSAMLYIDSAIVSSKIVGDPTRLALAYLNKADYYMQMRNFKQSLINCDSAWRYAELANNNDRRARILQTIGAIFSIRHCLWFTPLFEFRHAFYDDYLCLFTIKKYII